MRYWVEEFDEDYDLWELVMMFGSEERAKRWIGKQDEGEFRIIDLKTNETIYDSRKKHLS